MGVSGFLTGIQSAPQAHLLDFAEGGQLRARAELKSAAISTWAYVSVWRAGGKDH
jgi:hypothetical protein